MKYKSRLRSRISNLKDQKNPDLRRNVLCGTISPERIATMTAEVRFCLHLYDPWLCSFKILAFYSLEMSVCVCLFVFQEMASAELKEMRKALTKESIREHQLSKVGGTETDMFVCGKCKGKSCTYTQVKSQTPLCVVSCCMILFSAYVYTSSSNI